jgi:hypothetical protein
MGFFGGGGSSVDLASPPAIGSTTPNTGAFTSLTVKASTGLTDRSITGSGTNSGLSIESSNTYILTANQYATRFGRGGDLGVTIRSDSAFGITSGNADATIDTILRRDAANTFAQRNSTNAQTFRLYNTFTDASNYERGIFSWSSNVLEIGSECAGTGATRTTRLVAQDKAGGFSPVVELAFKPNNTLARRLSFTNNSGSFIQWGIDGTFFGNFSSDGFSCGTKAIGFSQSPVHGLDAYLIRDDANIIAQRNSTNAQTFRLYNTYTSSTNFERLNFRWASNEFILDAEKGSAGGTLRGIKIGSATTSLLGFYGVTPVDQPATVTDPTGGGTQDAEARTAINAIIDRLQELGLIA